MPYRYPLEIAHADFVAEARAPVPKRHAAKAIAKSTFEHDQVNTLSTVTCTITSLWLAKRDGAHVSRTSFGDEADPIGADATTRAHFAPVVEDLRIRWKLTGATQIRTLRLALFRRDRDEPLWTKRMTWKQGECPAQGRTPFNGKLTADPEFLVTKAKDTGAPAHTVKVHTRAAEPEHPDGCVTAAGSPYKLVLTIESVFGAPLIGPTRRFVYFDVLVHSVKITWGDQPTAEAVLRANRPDIGADFRDQLVACERGILTDLRQRQPTDNHQVILDSDLVSTALNEEGKDDTPYRLHQAQWGHGPEIPLFAKVLIQDSGDHGVDCPAALGGARFLWDYEETNAAKQDYWFSNTTPQRVKDYVRDTLACMVDEEHQTGYAPHGATNTHRIHGGKRGQGAAPIFPPQAGSPADAAAVVNEQLPFVVAACPDRRWAALSTARNKGLCAGHTGVVFQPSRIAGDCYKLSVYFVPHDPNDQFPFADRAAQLQAVAGLPHDSTGVFETWRRVHVLHLHRAAGQPACDVATVLRIYKDAGTILDFPPPAVIDIAAWNTCMSDLVANERMLANSRPWLNKALSKPQPATDPDGVCYRNDRRTRRSFEDNSNDPDDHSNAIRAATTTNTLVDHTVSSYAKTVYPDFKGVLYFQFRKKHRYLDTEAPYSGGAKSFLAERQQATVVVFVDPTSTYAQTDYDSLLASKPRDPIIAHELGHALFLEHAPTTIASSTMHQAWTGGSRNTKDGNQSCLMNYHPDAQHLCGMCVLRLRGWSLRGHEDQVNDGVTVPLTMLGAGNIVDVHPQIEINTTTVVKPEAGHTTPARVPIRLAVFKPVPGGQAELRRACDDIHLFRAAAGGADIFAGANTVNLASNTIEGAGLQLYAEAMQPSADHEAVVLTLDARNGESATVKLTAVELELDIHEVYTPPDGPANDNPLALSIAAKRNPGRDLMVQNPGASHERALLVVKVTPPKYKGALTLRRRGNDGKVRVFDKQTKGTELLGAGETSTPFEVVPVDGSKRLWVEGSHASVNLRDIQLGVGVENGQQDGDHVVLTAIQLDIEVELPVTPHRTKRHKQGSTVFNTPTRPSFYVKTGKDWDANPPLVLLGDSAPAAPNLPDPERDALAQAIELRATHALPAGGTLAVQVVRAADDEATIARRGTQLLPTLNAGNPAAMSLLLDAVGSFHVHAFFDTDNSGVLTNLKPSVCINLVIVQASEVLDQSVATSVHAACDVLGDDLVLRTHGYNNETFNYVNGDPNSGPDRVPLHLKTTVELVGGGPDGRRGLEQVFAGWINNVTEDMAEATYSRHPREANYSTFVAYQHELAGVRTAVHPGPTTPVLDKREAAGNGAGGTACLARSVPKYSALVSALPNPPLGCHIIVQALDAPLAGWDKRHKRYPDYQIQSMRVRVRFAAFLSLWTDANEHYGGTGVGSRLYSVLRKVSWKAEGQYRVTPAGPQQEITPITVVIENNLAYPGLTPACTVDLEVYPPTSGDLITPREADGTPLGRKW